MVAGVVAALVAPIDIDALEGRHDPNRHGGQSVVGEHEEQRRVEVSVLSFLLQERLLRLTGEQAMPSYLHAVRHSEEHGTANRHQRQVKHRVQMIEGRVAADGDQVDKVKVAFLE